MVDASVALRLVVMDELSPAAEAVWSGWIRSDAEIIVPALFHAEVTSTLRMRVHSGRSTPAEGAEALEIALLWNVTTWPRDREIQRRAYDLATRFGQSRAYDSQYLAVAEALGCELWTADKRLYNGVQHHLPWVRNLWAMAT